ncbi:unnamed protein product [Victoria cruziana]
MASRHPQSSGDRRRPPFSPPVPR